MSHKILAIVFTCLIVLSSFACTNEDKSTDLSIDSFATLALETVFEFTESDDVAFRFIRSMKADRHGNILVNDPSQPAVFMFDGEGNLIQKIGKSGRGPGEFQNVGSFLVAQDSLAVSDASSHKIEIFIYREEKYEHVRTISVENQKLLGNLLGLTEKGILTKNDISLTPFAPNNITDVAVSLLGYNGEVRQDTVFSVPVHEFVVGESFVRGKIYGNSSKLAYDDSEGRVCTLWTEALVIDCFALSGEKHNAFSYPLQPVKITQTERDSVLNYLDDPERRVMRQHMPDVKPVAGDLVIDDQQRVWVELQSEEMEHGWFAFSPDGEPLFHIKAPHPDAFLRDVHENTILWSYTNEHGAPAIVKSGFESSGI